MILDTPYGSSSMEPKYKIGQKVIVIPVKNQSQSARDSDIEHYAGQSGAVTNYYWISPIKGKVFYIYTIQFGTGQKEIILHEDEIEADTVKARKK